VTGKTASIDLRTLPLADLKPHPRNPRQHPDPGSVQWEILKKSLAHVFFDPLVWNESNGMLVSGHLRLKLLLEMGYENAAVSVVHLDEPAHLAVMIHANKHGGDFNPEVLKSLVVDIDTAGLDAALAGFDAKAFAMLLECPEVTDDTDSAEALLSKADQLQLKWKVEPGDLFQIGAHRLLCGKCESLDNWSRLLQGAMIDIFWTDPPYNVDYESIQKRRNELKLEKGSIPHTVPQGIMNDKMSPEQYLANLRQWFTAAFQVTKPGGVVYIAHADSYGLETRLAARDAGWYIAQTLIWVKNAFTLGRQDYQWQHEPVLYGWKKVQSDEGSAHYWQGGYKQSTIIDDMHGKLHKKTKPELIELVNALLNERETTIVREPRNIGDNLHPTVKPVRLVARQIWNSSARGERVGELFGGSGTTIVASEQIGRVCYATELDPKYCAVILERCTGLGLPVEKVPPSV